MITTITEIVIMTGTVILTVTKIGGIDIDHVQRINQGTDPDQSLHPIPPRKASGEVVLIWRHLLHPCCLVLLFQVCFQYCSYVYTWHLIDYSISRTRFTLKNSFSFSYKSSVIFSIFDEICSL